MTISERQVRFRQTGVPKGVLVVDGWEMPIAQGRHEARDRRVYVKAPHAHDYDLVSIPAIGALVRALFMNEDVIRGPDRGMRGGVYLLEFIAQVCLADQRGELGPVAATCRDFKLPVGHVEWRSVS